MTEARNSERPNQALAAEYVLGVLPHEERVAFEARLERDTDLKEQVLFWNEQLVPLSEEVDPVEPPAGTFSAIEERLFPKTPTTLGWWSNLRLWRGLAIASASALVVVASLYLASLLGQQPQDGRAYVAEIAGEADAVRLLAFVDVRDGVLKVNRTSGSPAEGRDFELWLIEGDNKPVSLGVLPASRTATLAISGDYQTRLAGAVLAVSDEPSGGSPTGQPTGAVLATGEVFEIDA